MAMPPRLGRSAMNSAPLVLTKNVALKRHVLGLKQVSREGVSTKLIIGEIVIGDRLIPGDPKVISLLVLSIQQIRQTTPILVRLNSDGCHALIDGFNRIEALKQLGETEVLASLVDVSSDEEAKAYEAISNNHRRQKLSALDRALTDVAYLRYLEGRVPRDAAPRGGRQPKEKFQGKTARELGVSPDQIARSCKIAKIVPYVQDAIRRRKLEDSQSLLLEIASSGEDVHSQTHTLGRILNRLRKPEAESSADELSKSDQLRGDNPTPFQSQSSSPANRAAGGRPSAGKNGQSSGISADNKSESTIEGANVDASARPGSQTRAQPVGASKVEKTGPVGGDKPETKDCEKHADVGVCPIVLFDIPLALRAKLASFADDTEVRINGILRLPLGADPSIEVRAVTEIGRYQNERNQLE